MNTSVQFVSNARQAARQGDFSRAATAYRKALSAQPKNPEIMLELAVLEAQQGNLSSARRQLEKALKIAPGDANIPYNLGQIAREENQLERAIKYFRRAVELDPDYADAHYGIGEALYSQGKSAQAIAPLDRSLALNPKDPEVLNCKGIALTHQGKSEQAVECFRAALKIDPEFNIAKLNLADALPVGPENDEAIRLMEEVEKSSGLPEEFLARAASVYQYTDDLQRALDLADAAVKSRKDVSVAHIVRAKVLQQLGQFEPSEESFRKAIKLDPMNGLAYHGLVKMNILEDGMEKPLRKIMKDETLPADFRSSAGFALFVICDAQSRHDDAFDALLFANKLEFGSGTFSPDRHFKPVNATIETLSPQFLAQRQGQGYEQPGTVFICGMPRSGTTLVETILAAHPDVTPGGERRDIPKTLEAIRPWHQMIKGLDADWASATGKAIHDAMFEAASGSRFVTDKLPGNYTSLGFINWILPGAKLIYCHRHPNDNALSLFEQNFGQNLRFSSHLSACGTVYAAHNKYMQHWRETCKLDIHEVNYDELVKDPEPHIRALLAHVGLDWHDDCLNPQSVKRTISTASLWQARQPISAKSVGRWKPYARHLKPFVDALEAHS